MKVYKVPANYRNNTFLWLKFLYCIEAKIALEYSTLSLSIGLKHYVIEHKGTLIGYISVKVLPSSNTLYVMESYLLPNKRYYLSRVIFRIKQIAKKQGYNGIVLLPSKETISLYRKHKIAKDLNGYR